MTEALWAWITVAVVLSLAESFTGDFLALPWGIGAGVAAILAALHRPVGWQWIAFLGISAVLTVLAQRFLVRRP